MGFYLLPGHVARRGILFIKQSHLLTPTSFRAIPQTPSPATSPDSSLHNGGFDHRASSFRVSTSVEQILPSAVLLSSCPLTMTVNYAYSKIMDDRSIRILRVHGAPEFEPEIHCDIIERSLDVLETAYEALSYCWGDQQPSQVIICNGQRLFITKNCEAAIRYFRPASRSESRLLWIDAACIDQSSIPDRSHQVQLMGEIYKGSSQVLVWLENDNSLAQSVPLLDRSRYSRSFAWLVRLGEAMDAPILEEKEARLLLVAEELQDGSDVNAASIKELLEILPWFKRVWVIQEAVLGKETTLVYANHKVQLDFMLEARQMLNDLQKGGRQSVADAGSSLWDLFAVHAFGKWLLGSARAGKKSLTDELCWFIGEARYSMATNAKDKLLGLYGLLSESGISLPAPDYNKSEATIYREATVALIQATNSLRLLFQVDGLGSLPGRSSWVPDWSSSKHSVGPAAGPCSAVGDSEPIYCFLQDSTILILKGLRIDRVVKRSSLSYMHISERVGAPINYMQWTRNPPIADQEWAEKLEQQPEKSPALLFFYNVRVLRDFITTALPEGPAVADRQSVRALYHAILSQRGGYDSSELGLYGPDGGESVARDFFTAICGEFDEQDEKLEPDNAWIFGHDYALQNSAVTRDLLQSREYSVLQHVSRTPVRRLIFDGIRRMAYMTVFTTAQGRVGIAPWPVECGDEVVLCSGVGLPILMRPVGSNFKLVTFAYLHGVMYGEAWTQNPDKDLDELQFV